ncbi:MAG: peptide chain release factor N(5)-glutamine methyltransferase, partial [Defluviitaleaceae bacterium]|nr:peptide chain release factor N(5)-glutamine methyltransferase [Defluviitaleaceae bacterium]
RHSKGEPIEYIINKTNFMGLDFYVDENVLIPRPETELLVEEVLKYATKDMKILDLCTGSGCILISLAKHLKVPVTGIDISYKALKIVEKNAKLNDVEVIIRRGDMLNRLRLKYDIIVSNPPYIKTSDISTLDESVKNYEPHLALDGGNSGMYFYEQIRNTFEKKLLPNGMLFLEIGHDQGEAIRTLFKDFDTTIKKDYAGHDRIAIIKTFE